MYIKVNDLLALLSNPAWQFYKDTNGNTVFHLINKCKKYEETKKQSKKKGGK